MFDEVVVFARVTEIPEPGLDKPAANGHNVSFISLPTFIGPWQYLKCYHRLNILARQTMSKADAYILRLPSTVASLLWHHLEKKNILPLKYNSPQLPYLLKIMGYCFGDGVIYFENKKGKGNSCFYGKPSDLEQIKQDIFKTGFESAHIYTRHRQHKIKTNRYFFSVCIFSFSVEGSKLIIDRNKSETY